MRYDSLYMLIINQIQKTVNRACMSGQREAVGMVETTLPKLSMIQTVEPDDERKTPMVSNHLVLLCVNRDTRPFVNSASPFLK